MKYSDINSTKVETQLLADIKSNHEGFLQVCSQFKQPERRQVILENRINIINQ